MKSFIQDYTAIVADAVGADIRGNYDVDRFGPESVSNSGFKETLRRLMGKLGFISIGSARQSVHSALRPLAMHLGELEWLYSRLADDESRQLLVSLTAYRALGHTKIKLPTNNPKLWQARELAAGIVHGKEEITADALGWKLYQRNLAEIGYPIRMFTMPGACYHTFVLHQYRCQTDNGFIQCSQGDVVVDAGGCYGDTALYFAHEVGSEGRVASFEFLSSNLEVFNRNLALNPQLASRIRLYQSPVYSETGRELFVVGSGPGTQVLPRTTDALARKVRTLKIDDLVASGDFPRIDFIKMDIEGSELEALKGSEKVLRGFKPKLAITVYHDFKDFWTIPQYLDSLGLGYQFFLRHFTIHAEETVLFARAM